MANRKKRFIDILTIVLGTARTNPSIDMGVGDVTVSQEVVLPSGARVQIVLSDTGDEPSIEVEVQDAPAGYAGWKDASRSMKRGIKAPAADLSELLSHF